MPRRNRGHSGDVNNDDLDLALVDGATLVAPPIAIVFAVLTFSPPLSFFLREILTVIQRNNSKNLHLLLPVLLDPLILILQREAPLDLMKL
jgi:hypothetical protein